MVLAIDRQRFTLRTTPLTEQELTNRVRQVRQVMEQSAQGINTDRSTSLDPMVLYRLYQDLIAPAEDSLRSAVQVLVVADGALYNLPLELLVTAYGETEKRDGSYWVLRTW